MQSTFGCFFVRRIFVRRGERGFGIGDNNNPLWQFIFRFLEIRYTQIVGPSS